MTRIFTSDYRERKYRKYPDPFPVEKLERVDRPTSAILCPSILCRAQW
jgi:hypothetical protein